jgi:hypothetical protein
MRIATRYVQLLYSLTRLTLEGNLATSSLPCNKIMDQPNCNNLGKNRKNIMVSVFSPTMFFLLKSKTLGEKWIFFGPVQIRLIFLIFGGKFARFFRSYYTREKP